VLGANYSWGNVTKCLKIWIAGSMEIIHIILMLTIGSLLRAVIITKRQMNLVKMSDSSFNAFSLEGLYFLTYLLQILNISFWSSTTSYVTRFTTLAHKLSELPPLNLEFP
jgi:hypothetical protein